VAKAVVTTVKLSIGDPVLARRVRAMLTARRGFDIVAADRGSEPEVLITDTIEELSAGSAGTKAAVVFTDASGAADALHMGATAVLPADADARAVRAAVRSAAAGLTTLSAEFRRHLIDGRERHEPDGAEDSPAAGLTARELQVLQLLVEGASNKAIARRLGITPHTVKFHVAAIAGKLGASGRTDAVAKAVRQGLVMV
jgi:DNA-binding NarL/FixJ family response regulator